MNVAIASDPSLMERLRLGDGEAARAFHEEHVSRIFRIAWRIVRDDATAEDVTQETFVRAFAGLATLRDDRVVVAWLSAIAVRLSYNALRRQRRDQLRFLPLDAAHLHAAGSALPDPVLRDRMAGAIAALSEKYRCVLVMYELEGFSHAEIAAALAIPVATSKTRLFQARATLRTALADLQPEVRP